MQLKTVTARLENGLQVIVREVHSAPIVSTWVWYRVGSRHEREGSTGLSHWVEHMLFKGSARFGKGEIMRAVNRHGGYLNAMTSYDFTTYYETLPSACADLALDIEADRMANAAFDPAEVEAERTVIIAEREGSENEPRYVLNEEMVAAAFRVHPYHHQPIGWKADLERLSREALYDHYRRYYVPNNAVLVAVGDVDAADYVERVRRAFEALSPGETPDDTAPAEPPQRGERRVTVRLPGSAPMMRLAYHAPPVSHPDYLPLVVLDAVLSGGKAMFAFGDSRARSARLYRALVETELASSAGSHYHPSRDPFLFSLGATVRAGREPAEVEEALLEQVALLRREPVSPAELAVAIRQTQAQFAYASEAVSSQALALGFLEMVDDHRRVDRLLDELGAVSAEDVLRVAQTYLIDDNGVVGWFLPLDREAGGAIDRPAEAPPSAWRRRDEGLWGLSGGAVDFLAGPSPVLRRVLPNGVVVIARHNPASPSVTIQGNIRAGGIHAPAGREGLAGLTASMLRRGTRTRSYQEMNQILDGVGASLSASAGLDDAGFEGRALADDLGLLVDLLAEMLREPAFAEVELERLRGQVLTHLTVLESDTSYRADRAFMEALYGAHPYGRPTIGTRESVATLTRDELVAFHRQCYTPQSLVLSVVGAVPPEQAVARLEATLGDWHSDHQPSAAPVPQAETPEGAQRREVHIPAKSQVDLVWGVVGMPRTSPDYYAAMLANLVLGRLGLMGRLGQRVRDELGLAYYVSSSVHAGPGPHPWSISAGVNPRDVDRAVEAILGEVRRLREEPIDPAELSDAQTYLTGALPLYLETNEGIASMLLTIEEYGLGYDYLQRYPEIIGAITREDVQRAAARYLTLDRYVLALAGTLH